MMEINRVIEHTILKPDCSLESIRQMCDEVLQHQFLGVCVPPFFVRDASRLLNEQAKVVTVVGFPMGYSTIPAKMEEIKRALDEGADEVDAVVNICAVKSRNWVYIKNEMDNMMRAVGLKGKSMKLIVETGLLTREELRQLIPIAEDNGVQFIKTSTGVNGAGATVDDVRFLREFLHPRTKIKASGGIKTLEQAEKLVKAGADRIGTSSSIAIVSGK
jgi:deoxyribose-phosphate aldolase